MASSKTVNCPKESSDNFKPEHKFFWGVHSDKWCYWYKKQEIHPNVFNIRDEDGMSVDWNKHCSNPHQSFKYLQNPVNYRVMQITVKAILEHKDKVQPSLELEHTPLIKNGVITNCAHSLIKNFPPKRVKILYNKQMVHIRALLADQSECNWAIAPSNNEDICD